MMIYVIDVMSFLQKSTKYFLDLMCVADIITWKRWCVPTKIMSIGRKNVQNKSHEDNLKEFRLKFV